MRAEHIEGTHWVVYDMVPGEVDVIVENRDGIKLPGRESRMVEEAVGEVFLRPDANTAEDAIATWEEAQKPPQTSEADVMEEVRRRLAETDWMVVRAADPTSGKPIPDEVVKQRQAIRDAAEKLTKRKTIPADFRDDSHWLPKG